MPAARVPSGGGGDRKGARVSIPQALALLALLLLLTDDGFRELFLTAIGYVLFWGGLLILPVFLWALLVAAPRGHADMGPGTRLLFGLWWALILYFALTFLLCELFGWGCPGGC